MAKLSYGTVDSAWRRIYRVERAEGKLRAAGCPYGFVKMAFDYVKDQELVVVEVHTADGQMKFEEPYDVFPSNDIIAKIALVAA